MEIWGWVIVAIAILIIVIDVFRWAWDIHEHKWKLLHAHDGVVHGAYRSGDVTFLLWVCELDPAHYQTTTLDGHHAGSVMNA